MEISLDPKKYDKYGDRVIEIPDYEKWIVSHPDKPLQPGEERIDSEKVDFIFNGINEEVNRQLSMTIPATAVTVTNFGRFDLYYFNKENNTMYPLGNFSTNLSVEELEQLNTEQIVNIIFEGIKQIKTEEMKNISMDTPRISGVVDVPRIEGPVYVRRPPTQPVKPPSRGIDDPQRRMPHNPRIRENPPMVEDPPMGINTPTGENPPMVEDPPIGINPPTGENPPIVEDPPTEISPPARDNPPMVEDPPIGINTPIGENPPIVEDSPIGINPPTGENPPMVEDPPIGINPPTGENSPMVEDPPIGINTPIGENPPIVEEPQITDFHPPAVIYPYPFSLPPDIETTKNEPEEEEENEVCAVVAKRKWSKWASTIALLGTIAITTIASLGIDDVFKVISERKTSQTATYNVEQMVEKTRIASEPTITDATNIVSSSQSTDKVTSDYSTGDQVTTKDGTPYYYASDIYDIYGTIGTTRPAGDYTLQYVSVIDNRNVESVDNPQILGVEYQEGVNVGEMVQNTLDENGLSLDDVKIMIHITSPEGDLGWVDMSDIVQAVIENEEDMLSDTTTAIEFTKYLETYFVSETYEGEQNDFDGTINLSTDNGEVSLDIMDENGDVVEDGTEVIGSDGNTYIVQSTNLETVATVTEEKVDVGDKLTFSIQNLGDHKYFAILAESLLASGVFALALAERKKRAEEEKTKEDNAERNFVDSEYHGTFDKVADSIGNMSDKKENFSESSDDLENNNVQNDENDLHGGVKR